MQFFTRSEAQQRINSLSSDGVPFLFVISYDCGRNLVLPLSEVDPGLVLYSFPSGHNDDGLLPDNSGEVVWDARPESFESYSRKFRVVQDNLRAGNSFLTNLTCRIPVLTNLSLRDVYLRSRAPYRLWLRDHFVCFSPEKFVFIDHGLISSFPMKGTIDASLPDAARRLMDDQKEAAEHATIVDLIRNDLSIVASHVHVPRYRYVESLRTNKGAILQSSSEIRGSLPDDYRSRLGDILFSQLPAGSITGAPKPKTVGIISQAEDYDRGFYTGVMGICRDSCLESAVMIRFLEQDGDSLHDDSPYNHFFFKAGGGVTARSLCRDEYNEIIQKTYVPIY